MKNLPRSESVRPAGILAQTRAALASWLWKSGDENPRRGRLLLEQLEQRQLMAGDTDLLYTDGVAATFSSSTNNAGVYAAATTAEGEAGPDLAAFAKALADAGVKLYGAAWNADTTAQRKLFEDGYKFLNFIEISKSNRTVNAVGTAKGLTSFAPTWEFPDNSTLTGVQTLTTLAQKAGVSIPSSNKPSFAAVPAQTVAIGSPMHLPIDAYNPGGGPITVTVSVANPALLDASVLSGNKSLRVQMEGYGDMVFQLFDTEVQRPAGRVITLADQGFYDGLKFHRIVDNFVLQGGDPNGTGSGGSSLGNFNDQFNVNLQHNRTGVLSFAKSTEDTNNSQFFITEGPQRSLDFNHSVFGQLIEGDDVREAISELDDTSDRITDGNRKPSIDIKMKTVTTFNDTENSLIRLKAKGNQAGSTTVTITATNSDGQTFTQVVPVSVVADSGSGSNSQPFLADIPAPPAVTNGGPATLQLSSTDVESDAVTYTAASQTAGVTATVNATTGLVTVTPSSGFTGNASVLVGVKPATGVAGTDPDQADTQLVTFAFQSSATVAAPTSVVLATASDSGSSNSDRVTNAGTLTFTVSGVTAGNEVRLFNGTTEIGRGTATSTTINITTGNLAALGDGTYTITARQFSGTTSSDASPGITVVYDGTGPVQVTGLPTNANIDNALSINLTHPEEGTAGLRYAFTTAPTGATIDASTGVVTWTPTSAQTGTQNFTLTLTDVAGNVRTQPFSVTVAGMPLAGVRLELTNLAGNVITSVSNGEEFLLKYYAQDLRGTFARKGVFTAFTDVTFNSALVQPVTGTPIQYGSAFSTNSDGTFAPGLIDELGAGSNNLAATNVGEVLVATVRMKAIGTGTVSFISDPAETVGNEFLLFDDDNAINSSLIKFGRADLAIGTRFTAVNDTVTVAQGASTTTVDVLANDAFTSGNTGTLTINSVGTPSGGGTVTIVNNKLSYKPLATFSGIETFTYVVKDETGSTQTATVTATVTATNSVPPTAANDSFTVAEDAAEASFNVRTNDSTTVAGATISVTAVGTPSKGGTVRLGADGASIFYKPAANANGTETVTYTLTDSKGATATGTVTFTVSAVNDAPSAVALTKTIFKSTSAVTVATLADYGTNVDGTETLTITLVGSASAGGTFAVSGTSITYVPPSSTFTGTDTISYKVTDAGGLSTTGTISLQVADGSPTQFLLAGRQWCTHRQFAIPHAHCYRHDNRRSDRDQDGHVRFNQQSIQVR